MLTNPLRHWLSLRIRVLCVLMFVVGSFVPPYIPKDAFAQDSEDVPVENPQFLLVEDGFLMKSSSLTEQGSRRAYAEGLIHTVSPGESVASVAQKYHIKPDTVRWANGLSDDSGLKAGTQLIILPVDGVLHTVTRGQTLGRIAELYGISATDIARQNTIDGGFIVAGQELIVPGARPIIAKPVAVVGQPIPPSVKPGTKPATTPAVTAKVPVNAPAAVSTSGILQMPCNACSYTQYYHPGHYAVDIQHRGGGAIYAAEAGTIIRADYGWNGGYGNVIEIDHGNGLVTLYGHNKELYVKKGDTVARGQNISFMGNTGRVYGKTGIHVHFEVRVNGVKKNPLLYLQ